MSVSRSLKVFGGEPGRPSDWVSQKSCAAQYDNLLTRFETPKRKKRGADGSKAEGVDLTPAELIVKQLTVERIEELRKQMAESRALYMRDKEELYLVQNGQADDRLEDMLLQIQEEKKQREAKQEEQQQWLRQREERKQELEMAWRPHAAQAAQAQQHFRGPGSQMARRPSNQSELGSETDNVESPSSSDQHATNEEAVESKSVSTPTSPLLTSLLKSPSPVTGSQSSSILHSAITSQRGASPTITSLLNSSPSVPSSGVTVPLSPNLKSLVSNALAGHDDVPKPQSHSASSSPTLSMLLELPPSTPGKLPELPFSATKQPTSTATSKPGDEKEEPTVEPLLDNEGPQPSEQIQPAAQLPLEIVGPKSPLLSLLPVEPQPEGEGPIPSPQCHSALETVLEIESKSPQQCLSVGTPHEAANQLNLEIEDSKSPAHCEATDEPQVEFEISWASEQSHAAVEPPHYVEAAKAPEKCQIFNQTQRIAEKCIAPDQLEPIDEARPKVKDPKLSEQCQPQPTLHHLEGVGPYNDTASVLAQGDGPQSLEKDHLAVESQLETPKTLEDCQPSLASTGDVFIQYPLEMFPSGNLVSSSAQVTSHETPQQSSLPQDKESSHKVVETEARPGDVVDALKNEPLPDNMEIVLPMEADTEVPEAESKVNLDATDLQQLSTDELEQYVVDPASIGVVLQELVPGLVDGDGVCLLNLEEADVSNMLDAEENNEASASSQVENELDSNISKDNEEMPPQEQEQVKEENENVSVVAHTSPALSSPQRTAATPQSTAVSPRGASRPVKGSMIARKIVMEEEDSSKSEGTHSEDAIQPLEGESETLSREDLENASIVFMQDGVVVQDGVLVQDGLVMKLNENEQATSIVNDIHVIQDSSSNSLVVVPHEDVISEKGIDTNQTPNLPSESTLDSNVVADKDIRLSPRKDNLNIEIKSPGRSPRKSSEKSIGAPREPSPAKKVDEEPKANRETSTTEDTELPVNEIQESEPSQPKEDSQLVEPNIPEETNENVEEVKEEESAKKSDQVPSRERPKKQKPLSPIKREKSPVISESSNEVASEEDNIKEVADEAKKDTDQKVQEKKTENKKESLPSEVQMEDEDTRHPDSETPVAQIKEEKIRADTPSTEDDNTRDTEQQVPVKRGRGRYVRESTANSESVPNSPAPTNVSIDDEKEHRAWKKSIMLVYNRIAQHKNASIFLRPITDDKAPGYSSMIFRSLDLQTIKKNIETGVIRTFDEFQRDILIMFNNAIMYNKSNSPVHEMAREMQVEGVAHLYEYKSTQYVLQTVGTEGGHLPSRRGTRTADKRDQDSDGFSTRRAGSVTGLLGKRKRSLPDDKVTPKRRRDDE